MKKQMTTHDAWKLTGIFMDSFLLRNIVLVQAIGLCPIVAVGVTLQNGVALTVCTAAVLLPCSLCISLLRDRIPAWLRPFAVYRGGFGASAGAAWLLNRYISHELYAALYLFLPLMAVNTIFTYRAGMAFSTNNRPAAALVDALGSSLGFGLVICTVSALRELASYGTLWNIPLNLPYTLPEAAMPYAAFIMLGFMAAFLQWFKSAARRVYGRARGRRARRKGRRSRMSALSQLAFYLLTAAFVQNLVLSAKLRKLHHAAHHSPSPGYFAVQRYPVRLFPAHRAHRLSAGYTHRHQLGCEDGPAGTAHPYRFPAVCRDGSGAEKTSARGLPAGTPYAAAGRLQQCGDRRRPDRQSSILRLLPGAIGLSLGSCLGFLLLSLLTAEARERTDNPDVPQAFRGLPITLVYLGLMALALLGFKSGVSFI